jgi:hypothetical protein
MAKSEKYTYMVEVTCPYCEWVGTYKLQANSGMVLKQCTSSCKQWFAVETTRKITVKTFKVEGQGE